MEIETDITSNTILWWYKRTEVDFERGLTSVSWEKKREKKRMEDKGER